jgi:hypothetical protein
MVDDLDDSEGYIEDFVMGSSLEVKGLSLLASDWRDFAGEELELDFFQQIPSSVLLFYGNFEYLSYSIEGRKIGNS